MMSGSSKKVMCLPAIQLAGSFRGSMRSSRAIAISRSLQSKKNPFSARLAIGQDDGGGVVMVLAPVLDDPPGDRLRLSRQAGLEVAPGGDAVAHQAVDVARLHRHRHHLGRPQVVADDPGQAEDARRRTVERLHLDVADAAELPLAVLGDLHQADGGAARRAQLLVDAHQQLPDREVGELADHLDGAPGGHRRFVAMAEAVDDGRQGLPLTLLDHEAVATDRQPLVRTAETTGSQRSPLKTHVTVVPTPGRVSSWKSSTSFLTATRPLPIPRCDL